MGTQGHKHMISYLIQATYPQEENPPVHEHLLQELLSGQPCPPEGASQWMTHSAEHAHNKPWPLSLSLFCVPTWLLSASWGALSTFQTVQPKRPRTTVPDLTPLTRRAARPTQASLASDSKPSKEGRTVEAGLRTHKLTTGQGMG